MARLGPGRHATEIEVTSAKVKFVVAVTVDVPLRKPAQAATIQLVDFFGDVAYEVRADGNGAFRFGAIDPDDYVLRVGGDTNGNGSFSDVGDWRGTDREVSLFASDRVDVGAIRAKRIR